jgi:hypothetical protein
MLLPSIRINCPSKTCCYGEIFNPKLVVGVKMFNGNYQLFEFILDSGADCTTVPRNMANLVGILLPSTPDTSMTDASGNSTPAYKGKLNIKFQNNTFEVRCLFTSMNTTPLLLGRLDFFDKFDIIFKGRNNQIEFTDNHK